MAIGEEGAALAQAMLKTLLAAGITTLATTHYSELKVFAHTTPFVANASVEFAFSRMAMHRIRCAAATDNFPSLRVIQRLGFRFEGIARQAELVQSRWLDHAVFAKLSSDE